MVLELFSQYVVSNKKIGMELFSVYMYITM